LADRAHFTSGYSYSANNPISFNDPSGLLLQSPQATQRMNSTMMNSGNSNLINNGFNEDVAKNAFINSLQGSNNSGGGNAAPQVGKTLFNASSEGFDGSPAAAYAALKIGFTGSPPAPDDPIFMGLVQAFWQATWGGNNQATNIKAIPAAGGYNLSYTVISAGNSHTTFFKTDDFIQEILNQASSLNSDGNDDGWETANNVLGTTGLAWDLTRFGMIGAQKFANAMSGAVYAVTDIGKLKLLKGISFDLAGKYLGGIGLLITAAEIKKSGLNWSNGTDGVMGLVAFILVVGWIISGVYFVGNIIVESNTGHTIGFYIGQFIDSTPGPAEPISNDPMKFAF
jgi:hypothetical protein